MSRRRSQIDVQENSCANCSATIPDAVESLDGVSEANINFATYEGSVAYNPGAVSLAERYSTPSMIPGMP